MISLHRLNGDEMTLNAELILTVEATPDTHIQTARPPPSSSCSRASRRS